jgi:hypothetical protein
MASAARAKPSPAAPRAKLDQFVRATQQFK